MKDFFKVIGYFIVIVVVVSSAVWLIQIVSTPAALVSKTLDADNIISQYEMFYNKYHSIKAAKENIMAQQKELDEMTVRNGGMEKFKDWNEDDKNLWNQKNEGLALQKKLLNEQVEQYNADAKKMNRKIFNATGCKEMTNQLTVACENLPDSIQ